MVANISCDGMIDDVRLYNVALDETEVADLYSTSVMEGSTSAEMVAAASVSSVSSTTSVEAGGFTITQLELTEAEVQVLAIESASLAGAYLCDTNDSGVVVGYFVDGDLTSGKFARSFSNP